MSNLSTHDALFGHFTAEELDILQERARTLAQTGQTASPVEERNLLTIQVGSERYALHMDSLLAIHDNIAVTPIPCTPAYVRGIANLRGHLVTVLDLALLLNGTAGDYAAGGKLLLLEAGAEQVALLINQTESVSSYAVDTIRPLPLELDHIRNALGILADGVVLIDIKALVDDPALIVNAEIAL
ncbi:MAG: chemotaxis protein CheW [Anaerolineae bacterium]|nr:chemotaxis protein CheW [Anaerolineae bacterium]